MGNAHFGGGLGVPQLSVSGKLKAPLLPDLLKISIKKGTRRVRTRYDTVLLPFISIVRCPGRLVILVPDNT